MTDLLPPWAINEEHPHPLDLIEQDANDSTAAVWYIRSDSEAEWAMAHVAASNDQIQAIDDQYTLWLDQLDRWRKASKADPARSYDFFAGHLAQYGVAIREQSGGKVKTLKLASGEIGTTQTGEKVIVIDDGTLIEWLEANGIDEAVKVDKKVLLAPLRAVASIKGDKVVHHFTGEVIPGVDIDPESMSAKVKPRPPFPGGQVHALAPKDV